MTTQILQGATLIDGTGKPPRRDAAVLIVDREIRQVGERCTLNYDPSQTETIDLSGKTLVPGLVDMHVHLGLPAGYTPGQKHALPSETLAALTGARRAREALLAGVTTVRDLGSLFLTNIKLRELVVQGFIPGPRIVACGHLICMTGGHGSELGIEVDSPSEARKAARRTLAMGADCLKLTANGLTLDSPELTTEEMKAAVAAAHAARAKVAAHASVWQGVANALAAGVDTIEHGYTLDEPLVETMLKQDTILVPTLGGLIRLAQVGCHEEGWRDSIEVVQHRLDTAMDSFQLAFKSGVKIALGTDGADWPLLSVGEVVPEFEALTEIGLSNMDAIRAATSVAAEGLGQKDHLGTIEPGKLADVTVLNRNPLEDLAALGDIHMVLKEGVIVVANNTIVSPDDA